MSDERDLDGGPQLDDLLHRARTELRDWTNHTDSDPGVALLELFAYVGELLSSYADRVADEAYPDTRRGRRPGRRDSLVLEVDGRPWRQVTDLADSGEDDRHYAVSRRADGASVIEFGDGVHGQRPPSGSSIGVRYRHAGRSSSVLLQEGRVVIDADWRETSSAPGQEPPGPSEEPPCPT
jgi:hypothetical protein